jgi:GTP:adenosylcobinamide-phosphate guanylyltransferase
MRAVITAGGRIAGDYARAAGTSVKALATVRGRTMLARSIDAARGAGASAIALVGTQEVRHAYGAEVERVVDAHESGAANVREALRAWPGDDALLYLASDLPFLDARALRDFVERACGRLTVGVVSDERFRKRFPGAPHPGTVIGGRRVHGAGAFLVPAGAAQRVERFAARFFDARKSPVAMARLAGIGVLVRFVTGTLRIEDLERKAQRVLGMRVQALADCSPELAYDADEFGEYRYACEHP